MDKKRDSMLFSLLSLYLGKKRLIPRNKKGLLRFPPFIRTIRAWYITFQVIYQAQPNQTIYFCAEAKFAASVPD